MRNDLIVQAIARALDLAHKYGIFIPHSMHWDALVACKFKAGMDLPEIEDEYNTRFYGLMDDYMQSSKPITSFRNAFRRIVYEGANLTAIAGLVEGGDESGQIPTDLKNYIDAWITEQAAFADGVWQELKNVRRTATPDEQAVFIKARADGYTGSLVGLYAYAKTFAMPDRDGLWVFGDTIAHCESKEGKMGCANLEGQTHKLSWYQENGYIPQQQGSTKITCGGWKCGCTVQDPKTGEQLLP